MDKNKNQIFNQAICFLLCFMLMAVVAVSRNQKLFGISLEKSNSETTVEPISEGEDGTTIINTTPLTKNIIGYAGTTPVEIIIKDGKINNINILSNNETPEFIGAVKNSDMLDQWYGKTLEEASILHVDAVSGATRSSSAIIKNIETGIAYAQSTPIKNTENNILHLDFKFFIIILVILAAAILPFFIKNKIYRIVQLIINVLILGFWGGTFISYSLLTSIISNGIKTWTLIPVLLMLVTAFIYPFFKKKNYYCSWICPYGSIQEVAGKCIKFKLKVSTKTFKILTFIRDALWVLLMFFMMIGLWFDWMDWEPFAAFFFNDASPVVLGIAGGFLILSFFIQRPYCRFVCPTGTLFKLSEGNK